MPYKSFSVYDQEDFFQTYQTKRKSGRAVNDTIELPIIQGLLGEVKGKEILDLGCGDGRMGAKWLDEGALAYHGIEGSSNMIQLARQHLQKKNATLDQADIEHFAYPNCAYDLAVSRLVFHYVEDIQNLWNQIFQALRPGGQLIFSIEHPIITSCYDSYHQKGKRGNWVVDHYFHSGERVNQWLGQEVIKYHKTIEEYFHLAQQTGFMVKNLKESKPQKIYFEGEDLEFQRRMRIPLFLFMKLERPAV